MGVISVVQRIGNYDSLAVTRPFWAGRSTSVISQGEQIVRA